jgi:hypothetical protein
MAKRKIQLDNLPSNNLTTLNKEGPIITGGVKTRRGGGLAEQVRDIGNSLFSEIVMPAIKAAVVDFFSHGVNMMMFGSDSSPRRGQHRSYNKQYRQSRGSSHKLGANRRVERIEEVFDPIFFEHREDAQRILGRMMEYVAEYGVATVLDLHSLAGLATNYTHQGWGWNDLSGTRVYFSNEGFMVDFPEPEYFN